MTNPLPSEDANDDRDGEVQKGTPILFEKFQSILEFWEERDLKAKQWWSKEKERHIRLEEEEALKIKAAEDALMAAKHARKIFIEHRAADSSIKTESSAVEDKVIRKTTERPKRPRDATALIRKNSEENINTDDGGLPERDFSMEDIIPYSPKERKAMKSNRAKKWKERIAKKKNKKECSKNANNQFETQEEPITDNNPKNHLEDENAPLNTTIEEERIPAFPEEEIVFHEGDAAKEIVLSSFESICHDHRFSEATEQQSQSLSMSLIDTLSVHSTSTISTKYSSSASFSSHSSPARSRKREIENWVHRQQSQSHTPSSSMDGTVCTASTITSTSIESNLLQRQDSLLADDERNVDQLKTDGTGLQHTRLFHQHEDCVDDQQERHDGIEYLSTGFDESGFDNYNDDEMFFPCAQPSQGDYNMSLSEKTDMQKEAQEDTFHGTDAHALMDHHVQHLEEELGYLEKEVYQLQEDLDICQQIAINWQQEAGLQTRRNERLEQEMQKAMEDWEKSTKCTQQQQELETTEEWKTTNGNLRRELANTQRQLECLKFAYENIRGTHDMDLDICGDQLTLLSNKVQEQSIIISRLTKENDQLKEKRIFSSTIENKMFLCPSVVSSLDDNKDGDSNSECSSPSQRQSLSSLSSVRSLQEDTTFAYNQPPLEILETEEDSVGATITVHEEEEEQQSSLRLENAYLERIVEISKTQIEELEAALESQQAASSYQMDLIEMDVTKSKETVVLLEEDVVRLKTESEAKVSNLREQIEAEKFEFEEEKERLLDRIIDLESNLVKSSAATTSFVDTDKTTQQESHIVHPMVGDGDGMMIEDCFSKQERETAASIELMKIGKQANAVDGDHASTCSEEDIELAMLQNAYENIQMSLGDIEDDNECLRDRIVDLEDETRTKERHWENENEVLRDRIVDLEKKLRDKEELLETLTAEAKLF